MSSFVPRKKHLREALLFCFHLKKSAAESHRLLMQAYEKHALWETTCREWFRRFKANEFDDPWQEGDAVHLIGSSRCCVF
ncbi:hypothetical protein JGG68_24270 [Salmonella enterica subsp. enterica serovar Albany]|nr:hypothetical protein [Salmonella enterica subsp. enterica serovar Albany]